MPECFIKSSCRQLKVTQKNYWGAYLKLDNDFHIFPFNMMMTISQAGKVPRPEASRVSYYAHFDFQLLYLFVWDMAVTS